jgi:UDP-N-acetylmuramate: L-alanyl-gamma-D-glutamyl-meso-diaminopimelate ligase
MNLKRGSRVYFIAIAGTGMSALAGLMKERGCEVSGSDVACYSPVSDLLRDLKISIRLEYDVEHLKDFNPDYVVIGNFVRRDNPQAQWVMERKIPYGSMPSTLEDYFLQTTRNLVVAGTHGKSTTSTCLAHLLSFAGRDPSYLIGAVSNDLGRSFSLGQGSEFVLEGDEYDTAFFDKESKFLHYRPQTVIWTSLEYDHADIFPSMDRLELMFKKLLQKIPEGGSLLYCRDWQRVHEIAQHEGAQGLQGRDLLSYGFHESSTFKIEKYQENESGISFSFLGLNFRTQMPGRFNAQNFAAAILAAHRVGVADQQLIQGLASFKGLKRRQEVRIEKNNSRVIDDFAHHPTAVKEVLLSLRAKYPKSRLVVFFEPRSNTTRRKFFQNEFVEAFRSADEVFLPEIFRKEALAEEDRLDVGRLIADLKRSSVRAHGPLAVDEMLSQARALLIQQPQTFVILSNGSFEGLHQKLIDLVSQNA